MALETTIDRKEYSGDNTTTAFFFPYYFLANGDLVVTSVVTATGVETVQVLDTDYTVTGAGVAAGGTVTFGIAPASTVKIVIERDPAATQSVDHVEGDPLPVDTVLEEPLDRLTMLVQRLQTRQARSLEQPTGDTGFVDGDMNLPAKVDRAGAYLAFDVEGEPTASAGTGTDTALRADLADTMLYTNGASLVALLLNLTGAGARSVRARLEEIPSLLDFDGVDNTGVTECGSNIQAAIDAVDTAGGGDLLAPIGTYLHADTINVPATVNLIGEGQGTIFIADAGFPATISSDKFGGAAGYAAIPAPQFWWDWRAATGNCRWAGGNFVLDGDDNAPTGMLITGGASVIFAAPFAKNHTVSNAVFDAFQNSIVIGIRTASAPTNMRVINITKGTVFINTNNRKASGDQFEFDNDAVYPGNGIGTGPERLDFLGGVTEDFISTTKDRILLMTEGTDIAFHGYGFVGGSAGACTVAGMELGANTANVVFNKCKWRGYGEEVPAIIDNGYQTVYNQPRFQAWGTTTLQDLCEVTGRVIVNHPHYTGINVTGKHWANTASGGSSDNDARRITYTPIYTSGTTGQRPAEDVDSYMRYFDKTQGQLLVWDFVNDAWVLADNLQAGTATNIGDAGHAINASPNKFEGRMIYDQTNNVVLWATGSTDTDVWYDRINAGAGNITPS